MKDFPVQEGISTRVDLTETYIYKNGGSGWNILVAVDWKVFNSRAKGWRWDEDDTKLLGTLKVPLEYLT